MNTSLRNRLTLIALVLGPLLITGCGATPEVSDAAGGRLNPALSDHQKAVLAARAAQNAEGGSPAAQNPAVPSKGKGSPNQSLSQAD